MNKKDKNLFPVVLAVAIAVLLWTAIPGAADTLRVYGTFNEGPGNHIMVDPVTKLKPENPPYTDPIAPFFPQAEEAPRKDHVTFNPAIMDYNQGYSELLFLTKDGKDFESPKEKVFKRMWYEKNWFKDDYKSSASGRWDVIIEDATGKYIATVPLDNEDLIHNYLKKGYRLREKNNDPTLGDTYAPSINQEFTYMALDKTTMPIMIRTGSFILVPMAHNPANTYRGINSFDADGDGARDRVRIESEFTLNMDIDNDGSWEHIDGDGTELSGDESIVLVLENKVLNKGKPLQFFDSKVTVKHINNLEPKGALIDVCDNEGGGSTNCALNELISVGEVKKYSRGIANSKGPFYVKLKAVSSDTATIEVGRLFGNVGANIGSNVFWNQKAFIVDEVFYNVVAIKARDDMFKYITFRQKLPKDPVKLYGKNLKVWDVDEKLAEMSPFNLQHEIMLDVQDTWTKPESQLDKIGKKVSAPPLEITFVKEEKEERFRGELKEIYNESYAAGMHQDLDVVFLIDATGSMWPVIGEVKTNAVSIMNEIDALTGGKAQFGVGSFRDYPKYYADYWGYSGTYGSGSDYPFTKEIDITDNTVAVSTALNGIVADGGQDGPESYTRALSETMDYNWRPGAKRVVVLFGDAPAHHMPSGAPLFSATYGGDPGLDEIANTADDLDYVPVIDQVAAAGITVISIDSQGAKTSSTDVLTSSQDQRNGAVPDGSGTEPSAIPATYIEDAHKNFMYIAENTGGLYFLLGDTAEIPEAIVKLIGEVIGGEEKEFWMVEWIHTQPEQFTEFKLQEGQLYLLTSGFVAPEAKTHIWDGDVFKEFGIPNPISYTGDRLKFWHDPADNTGIYVNEFSADQSSLRIYGTFNEGPGNQTMVDPVTRLKPENPPYTDAIAPFFPQAEEAPRKDHVTFNPAIMDYNQGYSELLFLTKDKDGKEFESPKEKVFKRMWYEKDWFKDDYKSSASGRWDVIIEDAGGKYVATVPFDDKETIHNYLKKGYRLREKNNDPTLGDTYAPSINQEFTYMALDKVIMPIMIRNGSFILVPMAHNPANTYRGINSFDADGDGARDRVRIESEFTLNMDIDNDGSFEHMDGDGTELSGDESIVLVLENKVLNKGKTLQFFDSKVTLKQVNDISENVIIDVCDNEGGGSTNCALNELISVGEVMKYSRGIANSKGPFYVKLKAVSSGTATIEVGRLFGNVGANIGSNVFWNQKAFIVDEVFYNVVAIKARDDMFKYITFRQKLPKDPVKLYGKNLKVWDVNEKLAEMPPFNLQHEIIVDVLDTWTKNKIGEKVSAPPLEISFIKEAKEKRFRGELKEIYAELCRGYDAIGITDVIAPCEDHAEFWILEWFHTKPEQFTEFLLPKGQKYFVTTGFFAPEAVTHIWDDAPEPIEVKKGDRLKFWHDPLIPDDIYVNDGTPQLEPGCPGDLNGDGTVNFDDFVMFADTYGTHKGDAGYNINADMDKDNDVDFDDFVIFAAVYGQICTQ